MSDLLYTGGNALYYTGKGAANIVYAGMTGLWYGYKWMYPDPVTDKEKMLRWRIIDLEDKLHDQGEMIKKINKKLTKDKNKKRPRKKPTKEKKQHKDELKAKEDFKKIIEAIEIPTLKRSHSF